MNIVFVQTAFLGDFLLSVPALKNLRKLYPEAHITLVCRAGLGSLMLDLNLVNAFLEIKKGSTESYLEVLNQLSNIDLTVSAHRSFRTGWFVKGIKAKKSIGFTNWWSWLFYNQTVKYDQTLHDALRQLSLLAPLSSSINEKLIELKKLNLNLAEKMNFPDEFSSAVDSQLGSDNSVLIYPGSVWATKRWTIQGYQELCRWICSQKMTPILMGSPDEKALCEQIQNNNSEIKNLAGSVSLLENIQLMKTAKAVVCNDNGGQHLASLLEIPTLSIFGPTSVEFGFRSWNRKGEVIQNKIACSPCGPHGHKQCPLGHHKCMKELSTQVVIERLKKIITR